ncbi:MAG: response regulator transcription factor [Chloroflexi bacterium]|nr:response regulator transcription factor [Chloroflexota bacterium]
MRIVVVEDDERISAFVARGLGAQGHQVSVAMTGADGIVLASEPDVDLVILDLGLPDIDGVDVLSQLRRTRGVPPVLVLTARDAIADKVEVLDRGADDYLTKPFALDELLARVRVLARRSDQPTANRLERAGLVLDLGARRATRDGRVIDLSTREFALLAYLMRNPGQVLSRVQILAAVWEYDFDPLSNVVDVYVRYLRRKIDREDEESLIETVRGAGYRFRA